MILVDECRQHLSTPPSKGSDRFDGGRFLLEEFQRRCRQVKNGSHDPPDKLKDVRPYIEVGVKYLAT